MVATVCYTLNIIELFSNFLSGPFIHSYLPTIRKRKLNEYAKFDCVVSEHFTRSWEWFINDEKVDQSDTKRYRVAPYRYLRIKRINPEDEGVYRCVVSNDFGSTTKAYKLIISGKCMYF